MRRPQDFQASRRRFENPRTRPWPRPRPEPRGVPGLGPDAVSQVVPAFDAEVPQVNGPPLTGSPPTRWLPPAAPGKHDWHAPID